MYNVIYFDNNQTYQDSFETREQAENFKNNLPAYCSDDAKILTDDELNCDYDFENMIEEDQESENKDIDFDPEVFI